MISSSLATITKYSVTAAFGVFAVVMFGEGNIDADFLVTMATKAGAISIIFRICYCIVLLFHIPYLFMATKECTYVAYNELVYRTVSSRIEARNAQKQKTQSKTTANTERQDEDSDPLIPASSKETPSDQPADQNHPDGEA